MSNFTSMTTLRAQCRASLDKGFDKLLSEPGRSFSQVLGNGFRQTVAGVLAQKKTTKRSC